MLKGHPDNGGKKEDFEICDQEKQVDIKQLIIVYSDVVDGNTMSFNQGNGSFATFVHTLTDKMINIFSNDLVNIGNTIKNAVMKNNYLKRKLLNYVYQNELSAINTVN